MIEFILLVKVVYENSGIGLSNKSNQGRTLLATYSEFEEADFPLTEPFIRLTKREKIVG